MQSKLTDIELIQRTLKGDQQAYALLVKRYERYTFTLALRFTKSREDAEEVAQDSFIKVYRALSSFKQESKFSTWLYTVVYTTAMTSLRKKTNNTVALDDDATYIQIESTMSGFDVNTAESRSRSYYLNEAIGQLPADDATVLTLFYHAEQSLEEIAQIMSIETNGVKVKLFRARKRLKEKLEQNLKHEVKELI
ncbi:RNA polymerase sigma factor [Mucilaginibacter auburnensis]|uniref:RNA polymerase sigma factor n=1 Tax=Mucilaginibacter auburnensis TaxID=1457233 RepID=A0A2H9VTF3_9SPHI|nr:sigma-70 family RNA polymerase sigma factor [Mucilaginibacter auburnensis]PJJ84100.1 RNA polymerase sigma-70 factor (ECF subfamily) [Mucilaginibacter auburnensis]